LAKQLCSEKKKVALASSLKEKDNLAKLLQLTELCEEELQSDLDEAQKQIATLQQEVACISDRLGATVEKLEGVSQKYEDSKSEVARLRILLARAEKFARVKSAHLKSYKNLAEWLDEEEQERFKQQKELRRQEAH